MDEGRAVIVLGRTFATFFVMKIVAAGLFLLFAPFVLRLVPGKRSATSAVRAPIDGVAERCGG